jgi:hypothetical protein
MATKFALDPKLIERAVRLSGARTKKAAITMALKEFIARRRQKQIATLMNSLVWDEKYDYKAERSR